MILFLTGCVPSNQSSGNTSLDIADFYGEYIFDEVAYMYKPLEMSEEHLEKIHPKVFSLSP